MSIEHIVAVLICGYAFFASIMWWTKASDCRYIEGLNKQLHEMLSSQFDAARGYREKICSLESRLSRIKKLTAIKAEGTVGG